jgi:hypothetical protein
MPPSRRITVDDFERRFDQDRLGDLVRQLRGDSRHDWHDAPTSGAASRVIRYVLTTLDVGSRQWSLTYKLCHSRFDPTVRLPQPSRMRGPTDGILPLSRYERAKLL